MSIPLVSLLSAIQIRKRAAVDSTGMSEQPYKLPRNPSLECLTVFRSLSEVTLSMSGRMVENRFSYLSDVGSIA